MAGNEEMQNPLGSEKTKKEELEKVSSVLEGLGIPEPVTIPDQKLNSLKKDMEESRKRKMENLQKETSELVKKHNEDVPVLDKLAKKYGADKIFNDRSLNQEQKDKAFGELCEKHPDLKKSYEGLMDTRAGIHDRVREMFSILEYKQDRNIMKPEDEKHSDFIQNLQKDIRNPQNIFTAVSRILSKSLSNMFERIRNLFGGKERENNHEASGKVPVQKHDNPAGPSM